MRMVMPADTLPAPLAPVTLTASDGLALAATQVAGDGPGLLFAHGFGQTRQAWSASQRRSVSAACVSALTCPASARRRASAR